MVKVGKGWRGGNVKRAVILLYGFELDQNKFLVEF